MSNNELRKPLKDLHFQNIDEVKINEYDCNAFKMIFNGRLEIDELETDDSL